MSKTKKQLDEKRKETVDISVDNVKEDQEVEVDAPVDENQSDAINGIVSDCFKLNVRVGPSFSDKVIATIIFGTKVLIDKDKSTLEWFKISTDNGITGYCSKEFIKLA